MYHHGDRILHTPSGFVATIVSYFSGDDYAVVKIGREVLRASLNDLVAYRPEPHPADLDLDGGYGPNGRFSSEAEYELYLSRD